jgi:hypothetical protein
MAKIASPDRRDSAPTDEPKVRFCAQKHVFTTYQSLAGKDALRCYRQRAILTTQLSSSPLGEIKSASQSCNAASLLQRPT